MTIVRQSIDAMRQRDERRTVSLRLLGGPLIELINHASLCPFAGFPARKFGPLSCVISSSTATRSFIPHRLCRKHDARYPAVHQRRHESVQYVLFWASRSATTCAPLLTEVRAAPATSTTISKCGFTNRHHTFFEMLALSALATTSETPSPTLGSVMAGFVRHSEGQARHHLRRGEQGVPAMTSL